MTDTTRRHRTMRTGGFTLLEVLVAVAILGMVIVGWMAAFGSGLRAMSRASEVAIATSLAEERLASIQLLAGEQLPRLPDSLESGSFSGRLARFGWSAEARAISGRDLAELTVAVMGPDVRRELSTFVAVLPLSLRASP